MPDLAITIEKAEAVPYAAAPTIAFKLRVSNADPEEEIHTVVLRCQIQIEAARRRYSAAEQENLRDLFGEPERWGQTVRNLLWANTSTVAPRFVGSAEIDVQVPCTFDFCVATTKFFNALSDGEIPVLVMFSGTIFYGEPGGALRVAPIPWNNEARFRLPVKVWKDMMDLYYPNSAWLCLRRDVFEELHRFKIERGIPTWEQALETLMAAAQEEAVK
jgi:hypothetical protein